VQVVGAFSVFEDTLYVEVTGEDQTPPQVLRAFADPSMLEPGSSTTIRVPKEWVVEGGSIVRMEARIYALSDSQLVDSVVLQEGAEEFWGEWSYGEEGRFFLRIFAEDHGGNRMETRALRGIAFDPRRLRPDLGSSPVGEELDTTVPSAFSLSQNYPNPFNLSTTIAYDLPQAADVSLAIYTITGQKVDRLVSARQEVGHYEVIWDGGRLASGIYFYRLKAGSFVRTRSMVFIK
jgi:hypothetical protein